MCGIFGYIGDEKHTNAQSAVLQGIKNLEYRGYDSWGIAIKTPNKGWWVQKNTGKIGQTTSDQMPNSYFAFGHTRWATHGGVTKQNAHPHLDCHNQIALIHNGIVENFHTLKQELINKGHIFKSQTDSEVIVHLIEELAKIHTFTDAVQLAFHQLKGASAIIVADLRHDLLVAIKNGSPLVIGFGQNQNLIASDAAALLSYTKSVYFMKDYDYAVIRKNEIEVKNLLNPYQESITPQELSWEVESTDKGKFKHFMLKEIFEQPSIIKKIVQDNRYAQELLNKLVKASQIHCIGCGTASHAGMLAKYVLSNTLSNKMTAYLGSEYQYYSQFSGPKTTVLAFSQSGETMDTMLAVSAAQKNGAKIIAAVNVLGSSLDRMADFTIPLLAGPEKAVASTKAFLAKITHIFLLTQALNPSLKIDWDKIIQSIKDSLTSQYLAKIKKTTIKINTHSSMFVIGRGISYPIALETALKIKEISYIHAEGLAAGELKHGVIALIEQGTPCIIFAPKDSQYEENITAAMELKARGGYIIGISPETHPVFDIWFKTINCNQYTAFQNTVIGQLIAYYLADGKGLDPDMPRNLAKSVTVK